MAYQVSLTAAAGRQLRRLPRGVQPAVRAAIAALAQDPRPPGVGPVKSLPGRLRIRIGDYRVFYLVDDTAQKVTVERTGHRSDVYR